ncbi:MAG TPA: hypothetical protein PKD53_00945 [Chloroflexaceae bacterium]|nr:hypothetical protein [Chloroflexaceae bacterium]
MSQNPTDGFDPNDPFGTWRTIRDANLDAWAKSMTSLVNTEAFAKAIGMQLDTMLAASAPMKQVVQQYMETYLAQVNMPSRGEVVSLAQRLTNIELRLDDMQAALDELLDAARAQAAAPVAAAPAPEATKGAAKPAAPRRARKVTTEEIR